MTINKMLTTLEEVAKLKLTERKNLKKRVLQFGTGNFLRGFIAPFIQDLNNQGLYDGSINIVQSSDSSSAERINDNKGLYHLALQGIGVDSLDLITCIEQVYQAEQDWDEISQLAISADLQLVVSNTTEAGIVYEKEAYTEGVSQKSFPAKITQLLYVRYKAGMPGLVFLPTELIENNGTQLLECIHKHSVDWNFDDKFKSWLASENEFCITLVDRIVSGFPRNNEKPFFDKLGFEDQNLVVAEPYHLMVIKNGEGCKNLLKFAQTDNNIIFTDDIEKYREAKVRVLNGGHTSSVLAAYLAGNNIVSEMIVMPATDNFLKQVLFNEVLPTINLPADEIKAYAETILERFANPFLKHNLLAISLNSVSKWSVRILPTLKDYMLIKNECPKALSFSLSALIAFYNCFKDGESYLGKREGESYPISDDVKVLEIFTQTADMSIDVKVETLLGNEALWGESLLELQGLKQKVISDLELIENQGMHKSLELMS